MQSAKSRCGRKDEEPVFFNKYVAGEKEEEGPYRLRDLKDTISKLQHTKLICILNQTKCKIK